MSFVAKLNWNNSDKPTAADLNRIEGGIVEAKASVVTAQSNVNSALSVAGA